MPAFSYRIRTVINRSKELPVNRKRELYIDIPHFKQFYGEHIDIHVKRAGSLYDTVTFFEIPHHLIGIDQKICGEQVGLVFRGAGDIEKFHLNGIWGQTPLMLNSLGLDARFLHTNTAVHGDLGMVGKKDIVYLLYSRVLL